MLLRSTERSHRVLFFIKKLEVYIVRSSLLIFYNIYL